MSKPDETTLDTAQMRRVADVPRTTDLARRLLHEAANEIDKLRASAMPLSDVNDLDAVVHALGIEDSDISPAEAVRLLQAEIEQLRERVSEFRGYGCPVCHGDCASANPPVPLCPMRPL